MCAQPITQTKGRSPSETTSAEPTIPLVFDNGWTPEQHEARVTLNKAVLAGDASAVEASLKQLPGWDYRVMGTSTARQAPSGDWVISQAVRQGLDPEQPLPHGAQLVVYSRPATGNGRLPAGERSVEDSLDIGGKVPAELDKLWVSDDPGILLFGAGRGLRYPDPNGGRVVLELLEPTTTAQPSGNSPVMDHPNLSFPAIRFNLSLPPEPEPATVDPEHPEK
jgi:hypothetical protein